VPIKPGSVVVLHHPTLSVTRSVDAFLEVARKRGARLLAVHAHNRRGVQRLLLGSFTETLLHHSRFDVLIAAPACRIAPRVRRVLLASDFTSESRRHLGRVLEVCKTLKAELTVFHAAQMIYRWSLDESNRHVLAYPRRTRQMAKWVEQACKQARVPVEVVIASEFAPPAELAMAAAKSSRADLVVVAARARARAALMGGSVTRQIVRDGSLPVLVLNPAAPGASEPAPCGGS